VPSNLLVFLCSPVEGQGLACVACRVMYDSIETNWTYVWKVDVFALLVPPISKAVETKRVY